jgi:sulfite exporter TauE/SafE
MSSLSFTLVLAAAGIGLTHTLLGPDHYLPFVMLARARSWSWPRTLIVTAACGAGHVAASVALGLVGFGVGAALGQLEALETGRGDWAAWMLIAFGVAYGAWGVRHGVRSRRGIEPHVHDGHVHVHDHGHSHHRHDQLPGSNLTFWALMFAFVLGPCEPLIPLFLVPASRGEWGTALATAGVFGVTTVVTMVAAVALALAGLRRLPLGPVERWSHALAGGVITASGLAIITLGL